MVPYTWNSSNPTFSVAEPQIFGKGKPDGEIIPPIPGEMIR
jgi:hypothetical protein